MELNRANPVIGEFSGVDGKTVARATGDTATGSSEVTSPFGKYSNRITGRDFGGLQVDSTATWDLMKLPKYHPAPDVQKARGVSFQPSGDVYADIKYFGNFKSGCCWFSFTLEVDSRGVNLPRGANLLMNYALVKFKPATDDVTLALVQQPRPNVPWISGVRIAEGLRGQLESPRPPNLNVLRTRGRAYQVSGGMLLVCFENAAIDKTIFRVRLDINLIISLQGRIPQPHAVISGAVRVRLRLKPVDSTMNVIGANRRAFVSKAPPGWRRD